jgi:hypothetical protein
MMTDVVFDPMAIDTVDQDSVEQTGLQFPIVQWHYGSKTMKGAGGMDYQGGWFIQDDMLDSEMLEAAGWQAVNWEHQDGSEQAGFWRREIGVSIIASRKRWEVFSDTGRAQVFDWNSYDEAEKYGRPGSRLHVLCLIKGLEDAGPLVLTMKTSAAMAFEGVRNREGAVSSFANVVIRAANDASNAAAKAKGQRGGKRWPYRAFWLPVGADRDGKGEPQFTEMGQGKNKVWLVLPVALGLPAKAEAVNLAKFYIGNELLGTVNEMWQEAEESWTHAWDTITDDDREAADTSSVAPAAEAESADELPDEDVLASLGI